MRLRLLVPTALFLASLGFAQTAPSAPLLAPAPALDKIAAMPLVFQDGTDTAVKSATEMFNALIAAALCEPVKEEDVMNVWLRELRYKDYETRIPARKYVPDLPAPKMLLALGQRLGVRFVIAGRVKWQTTSKWVSLGPKTKAYCSVDMIVIDVPQKSIIVEETGVLADSTRAEKGWETLGSLFVSMGFTALSGGPKTPHQERAAQLALTGSLADWIRDRRRALDLPKLIEQDETPRT